MSKADAYRIVLADDHLLFAESLKQILRENAGVEVVGETTDGIELLSLVDQLTPELVIVTMVLPNLLGTEAARRIKKAHPETKVLILSMDPSEEYVFEAISAKVDGFLLKQDIDRELFPAIEMIRKGKVYLQSRTEGRA